jgi:uracil-DNA glycosylase
MRDAQRKAWRALELGPVWRLTRGAHAAVQSDAQIGGITQRCVDAAPQSDRLDGVSIDSTVSAESMPPGLPHETVGLADWSALRRAVEQCEQCPLCRTRTQTVLGAGPLTAPWMLVGEAPGAEEDATGEPFVGQAGRLLDNMLSAIGRSRQRDVYIANVLKCRPPGNRDPRPEEVEQCEPYLRRQIELVTPRLIIVVGRFAAQTLLRSGASIASLRQQRHHYRVADREIPLVVTYHPAYLLRNLEDKAKAWADLRFACRWWAEIESG